MSIVFRFFLLLAFVAMASCLSSRSNVMSITADDPNIRYTGRWNFDDAKAPWVGWQGSTVSMRFSGSTISADIDMSGEGERLRVIVDGVPEEPARFIAPGRQDIVLASDLDPNVEHTLVLMKEAYAFTRLKLHGFETTDGKLLEMPPRPDMRIAFFGDSNMEGYSLYSEKNGSNVGTYFAYPATVSRMLGAEMTLQAVGGATLDGPGANDVVSFVRSEAYDRENPDYRDGFEPQLIVVNAGANDIYQVDPAQREQHAKENYRSVISALRSLYGDEPHIILKNGFGWDVDEPAGYSHEIVAEIGGNLSVHLFPWCWEQWHGDMVDHAGQARFLASYIETLGLGFSMQQDAEVVAGYSGSFDVANGSFEGASRDGYGAFGWRYFEDGVERIHDPEGAADGDYYIRLNAGELVHRCIDATGDLLPGPTTENQQYTITASIRSYGKSGEAVISADYEQQSLYQRENAEEHIFAVSSEWSDYSATMTAPDGTWQTYFVLKSLSGDIDFDDIRVTAAP